MTDQTAQVPFHVGDSIRDYFLQRKIGAGAYGAIFQAQFRRDQISKTIAIKLEENHPDYLLQEIEVFVLKQISGAKHFAKFYQCGLVNGYTFISMELLGPSVISVVNRKRPYMFSLLEMLKFTIQAIESIQSLHHIGIVHRDIKPDNFVIGNTQETAGMIYLIDFGLCKQLPIVDGKPTKPGNFRGTARYASPNSHNLLELGRQDDLISLLYMLVEYYTGSLPWINCSDPDEIGKLKTANIGGPLLKRMPEEFQKFEDHIFSLDITTEPDYEMLIGIIKSIANRLNVDLNAPFEWEFDLDQQRSIVHQRHKDQLISLKSENSQINQNQILTDEQMEYELGNTNLIKEIYNKNAKKYKLQRDLDLQKKQQQMNKLAQKQIQSPQTNKVVLKQSIYNTQDIPKFKQKLNENPQSNQNIQNNILQTKQDNQLIEKPVDQLLSNSFQVLQSQLNLSPLNNIGQQLPSNSKQIPQNISFHTDYKLPTSNTLQKSQSMVNGIKIETRKVKRKSDKITVNQMQHQSELNNIQMKDSINQSQTSENNNNQTNNLAQQQKLLQPDLNKDDMFPLIDLRKSNSYKSLNQKGGQNLEFETIPENPEDDQNNYLSSRFRSASIDFTSAIQKSLFLNQLETEKQSNSPQQLYNAKLNHRQNIRLLQDEQFQREEWSQGMKVPATPAIQYSTNTFTFTNNNDQETDLDDIQNITSKQSQLQRMTRFESYCNIEELVNTQNILKQFSQAQLNQGSTQSIQLDNIQTNNYQDQIKNLITVEMKKLDELMQITSSGYSNDKNIKSLTEDNSNKVKDVIKPINDQQQLDAIEVITNSQNQSNHQQFPQQLQFGLLDTKERSLNTQQQQIIDIQSKDNKYDEQDKIIQQLLNQYDNNYNSQQFHSNQALKNSFSDQNQYSPTHHKDIQSPLKHSFSNTEECIPIQDVQGYQSQNIQQFANHSFLSENSQQNDKINSKSDQKSNYPFTQISPLQSLQMSFQSEQGSALLQLSPYNIKMGDLLEAVNADNKTLRNDQNQKLDKQTRQFNEQQFIDNISNSENYNSLKQSQPQNQQYNSSQFLISFQKYSQSQQNAQQEQKQENLFQHKQIEKDFKAKSQQKDNQQGLDEQKQENNILNQQNNNQENTKKEEKLLLQDFSPDKDYIQDSFSQQNNKTSKADLSIILLPNQNQNLIKLQSLNLYSTQSPLVQQQNIQESQSLNTPLKFIHSQSNGSMQQTPLAKNTTKISQSKDQYQQLLQQQSGFFKLKSNNLGDIKISSSQIASNKDIEKKSDVQSQNNVDEEKNNINVPFSIPYNISQDNFKQQEKFTQQNKLNQGLDNLSSFPLNTPLQAQNLQINNKYGGSFNNISNIKSQIMMEQKNQNYLNQNSVEQSHTSPTLINIISIDPNQKHENVSDVQQYSKKLPQFTSITQNSMSQTSSVALSITPSFQQQMQNNQQSLILLDITPIGQIKQANKSSQSSLKETKSQTELHKNNSNFQFSYQTCPQKFNLSEIDEINNQFSNTEGVNDEIELQELIKVDSLMKQDSSSKQTKNNIAWQDNDENQSENKINQQNLNNIPIVQQKYIITKSQNDSNSTSSSQNNEQQTNKQLIQHNDSKEKQELNLESTSVENSIQMKDNNIQQNNILQSSETQDNPNDFNNKEGCCTIQ